MTTEVTVAPSEPIKLTQLKTAMLLYVPFFASLLLDMLTLKVGKFPELFGGDKGTAATDGKTIWFDEDFLASLRLPEAVGVTCHEIAHCMWMHMARGKQYKDTGFDGEAFDPRLWNIAGDYVINDMLKASDVGELPSCALLDKRYTHDMLVDNVYRELKKNPPPQGGNPIDGDGNDGSTLDHHILSPGVMSDAEWKRAVQTAADAAKAMGKMPAALARFVDQLMNPQVRWQDKLRFHVTRAVSRETTSWKSPHRRRLVIQGVYLPSYTGFAAGEIVVAVDTSGSIGQRELTTFFSELAGILDDCKPERVWVLGCDAAVNSVEELYAGHDLASYPPEVKGGGGTAFEPVFNWIEENGIEPASLIYFTDMYGSFPEHAPSYPVIWCATTDHPAPWGELVRIDVKES